MDKDPSGEAISHAHPLPNNAPGAAAAPNCSLNPSNEPNDESMAEARTPLGLPPPCPEGPIICQNIEWLECPPPLLRTAVRMSSGTESMLAKSSSRDPGSASGCFWRALLRLVT